MFAVSDNKILVQVTCLLLAAENIGKGLRTVVSPKKLLILNEIVRIVHDDGRSVPCFFFHLLSHFFAFIDSKTSRAVFIVAVPNFSSVVLLNPVSSNICSHHRHQNVLMSQATLSPTIPFPVSASIQGSHQSRED